ncbi:two-pore potassium channel 3-like [Rhodamnia argentea]|uniref:Two-pore potassium channel 3-like n=1 Tax=Rhodamnia argentea TaxID=178133 RepID=A0A8B8QJG1_9MYRT|nr:two-pore potassium channel 3-like [Rhodamnia argentea]
MDNDPLLQYASPGIRPPPLFSLPEDDEIALPPPLTPSELKDRLIFGPSPPHRDASPIAEAAALSLHPARPSSSSSSFLEAPPGPAVPPPEQPQQQSWLIDPNFFWSKSNLHRSKTAPAMAVINDLNRQSALGKPQFASPSIIRQAVLLLVMYLSLGVIIYWVNRDSFSATETHPVVDALYFCIVTMCTIGYGDITPNSVATKLFSIMFVLVGFGFVDILLTGMVSYVLDLQENYMLRSVKSDGEKKDLAGTYIFDLKKGRMRIRMKVALALGVVVICIGIGAGVMHFVENLDWLDSFYLSVMSVTTVGYGDQAFNSLPGRIFASIWLLVSTLAVARAFLFLAEARVDKHQRRVAKWVLGQDMTIAEFLAADIDNNGFVSKSEYVIYKLKEMKKVSEKDIMQICNKFDRLDSGNCGKITLADLMESRH